MTMGAIPAGAVENGREFLRRIAQDYEFECEGGKLANCFEYTEAVRCFEHLAAYVSSIPSPPVSGEVVEALREIHPDAISALRDNQRQLDMDGCEVGVSRQAVDEVLAALDRALTAVKGQ